MLTLELEARFPRQQTAVICMQVVWEECSGEQALWVREARWEGGDTEWRYSCNRGLRGGYLEL